MKIDLMIIIQPLNFHSDKIIYYNFCLIFLRSMNTNSSLNRINIYTFIEIGFLIFFLSCLSFPQITRNERSNLYDQYLTLYFETKNVPSISAGILAEDSIIWLSTKGFSDIENYIPASVNSVYRIASISKTITAVAIMQLWEKNLISLDDDVRKYIPYFPKKKWVFTIRQLLNHTSGIRTYREGEFHSKTNYPTSREAIKIFENDSLLFKPGTDYLYTTLGYTLLDIIVESVSKKPFSVYVKENIFLPAGMTSTYIDVQREIIPYRTRGYTKNIYRKLENAQLADLSIKVAGGGFLSTAKDLLLFGKALLKGTLLKPSTIELMTQPTRINSTFTNNYGLGFTLPADRSDKSFSHSGVGTGFTSRLLMDPVQKLVAVHLINISDRNLESPADELFNIYKQKTFTKPGYVISDTLMFYYLTGGLDSVFSKLNEIISNDSSGYSLDHTDIAAFGRDLIQQKKKLDAIDYLKKINRIFPNSFPIIVALADAYNNDGNKGLALRNYKLANQIDTRDRYVNNMIRRLSN